MHYTPKTTTTFQALGLFPYSFHPKHLNKHQQTMLALNIPALPGRVKHSGHCSTSSGTTWRATIAETPANVSHGGAQQKRVAWKSKHDEIHRLRLSKLKDVKRCWMMSHEWLYHDILTGRGRHNVVEIVYTYRYICILICCDNSLSHFREMLFRDLMTGISNALHSASSNSSSC